MINGKADIAVTESPEQVIIYLPVEKVDRIDYPEHLTTRVAWDSKYCMIIIERDAGGEHTGPMRNIPRDKGVL